MKQKVNKSKEQKTVLELSSVDLQSQLIPLRGEMVMLDSVVANVYGVETKRINEAVKNNPKSSLMVTLSNLIFKRLQT